MLLLTFGPFFERGFGLGLSGQDAFDRLGSEGAVAAGAFEGSDDIGGGVNAQQGQDAVGLSATVTLLLKQSFVEAQRRRPQRREALTQLRLLELAIDLRMLAWQHALLSGT